MTESTSNQSTSSGQWVDTGRLNVYFEEQGQGDPLLLLHGGLSTGRSWSSLLPYLADRYRVIIPDTRGHGRTQNPEEGLNYRQLGDDTAAFIQALNLERPVVVGWSDGGQSALELGMRHPGLARALVLGGVWFRLTETYLSMARAIGITAPGEVDVVQMEAVIPGVTSALKMQHGEARWEALARELATLYLTELDYTEAEFQAVSDSALVLLGDRDPFIPVEESVALFRLLPNAALNILPRVGHNAPQEAPEAFAATISRFLATL